MPDVVPAPATETEAAEAAFEAPRPRVGTAVMVAHALGAGAIPADLEGAGFEVVVATDGETALASVRAGRADIAIVDGRFEADGLAFCEQLWSENPGFPLLLIGPNDENLVTRALTSGADDYLALPLRPAELVARVRAVLRRAPHWAGEGRHQEPALRVGEVRLDPDSHEVTLQVRALALATAGVRASPAPHGERRDSAAPRNIIEPLVGPVGATRKHQPGGPYPAIAGQIRRRPGWS